MKTIIAGSRTITESALLNLALNECPWVRDITEVVCGMARGADMLGFDWAVVNGIPIKRFFPDWDRYGKRAGFIRNREMALYADAAIILWDGRSTGAQHMASQMNHLKKPYLIRQFAIHPDDKAILAHSTSSLPFLGA